VARRLIEAMANHLPPSAARLHLIDVGGKSGEVLSRLRSDLEIVSPDSWPQNAVDALVAYDHVVDDDFLSAGLMALRPGGRLIVVNSVGHVSQEWVTTLERAGYTRILVEYALDHTGILIRGEKPHTEHRTQERIRQVAALDSDMLDLATYTGRYVHLLVCQTPNTPVWKLATDERVEWQAVAIERDASAVLLAFSSLPKAVALMQPAVVAGRIKDVNKVAKFSRETARTWSFPVLLNPTMDTLENQSIVLVPVDPQTAEAPDE
jgi:hypothetical protein